MASILNERQFLERCTSIVLLDLWSATAAYVLLMLLLEPPPPYQAFAQITPEWFGYTVLAPLPIAYWLRRRMSRDDGSAARGATAVRTLFVDVPLGLTAYALGSLMVGLWSSRAAVASWGVGEAAVVGGSLLTFVAFAGIPLFVALQTLIGRFWGPRMGGRPLIPGAVTMSIVVVGIAVVASSALLLFEAARTSALDVAVVSIAVMLVGYAVLLGALIYVGHVQGVRPLAALIGRSYGETVLDEPNVVPNSLDELGATAARLRELLTGLTDTQGRLRDSEARFRMFAEAAGDFFYEIDDKLRISFLSERFEPITGIPASDALGLTTREMREKFDLQNYGEHQLDLERRKPYRNYRLTGRRTDGRVLHLDVSAIPHFDEHGRFKGYRGSGTNITPYVEAQQTLRVREAELAQAQKMEVVGQLTGGVAHDFNNLLTVILGNLELLQEATEADDALRAYVDGATEAAKHGGALTQRLLAFSRRQALSPESVDLVGLLDGVAELLRRTLGADISLAVEKCTSPLWPCQADRHQLENAILNLALNARDAMPTGGTLRFELSNTTVDGDGAATSAGEFVQVSVTDSGKGIAADVIPHVFEPFFTTKAPGEGSGLGLSMVYGFVKQSGGNVSIRSELGHGTRVTLLLPRAWPDSADSRADRGEPPDDDGAGRTILVIEDDVGVAAVISEALASVGYVVLVASNGEDAIERARQLVRLDLVLCDIVLPGAQAGIEVVATIRRQFPAVEVLFMSGYPSDEIRRRVGSALHVEVLKKPFGLADLAERVSQRLRGN